MDEMMRVAMETVSASLAKPVRGEDRKRRERLGELNKQRHAVLALLEAPEGDLTEGLDRYLRAHLAWLDARRYVHDE